MTGYIVMARGTGSAAHGVMEVAAKGCVSIRCLTSKLNAVNATCVCTGAIFAMDMGKLVAKFAIVKDN